ncbi:MAG: RnfABCDGE type electron transport complex subunit B [Spirochaetaceae bacterium]|jgi:Na+-translocating ferredoxin:NAD+ oxidoreductase RNF subunit RnfB|nr:RnfABCDGE type electron transport complex subunit B [Spirochaetaceae bacterium]
MNTILVTAVFAAGLALVLGVLLGVFRKVFHVETDVLVGAIRETLPGANCGACGFPGCDGFAAAVASGEAEAVGCTVSDADSTKKRAALTGGQGELIPQIAVVACRGTHAAAPDKGLYTGSKTCRAAKISAGGTKLCAWGCIGYGDCIGICPFGALVMGADGVPVVNSKLCKGCKRCLAECPQGIIRIIRADAKGVLAYCNNRNTVKAQVRKTCKNGCMKCELCVKKCPESAITMNNGIPDIDYAKCTSCGACTEACPQKVLNLLPV